MIINTPGNENELMADETSRPSSNDALEASQVSEQGKPIVESPDLDSITNEAPSSAEVSASVVDSDSILDSDAESDSEPSADSASSVASPPDKADLVASDEESIQDLELPDWLKTLDADRSRIIPLLPAAKKPPEHVTQATRPPKPPPKSGILNIDKPAGQTSHDVVAAVRRAAKIRRVGHAGTLDPMATGVLLVCFGTATRVIEELQAGQKAYRATLQFGVETDTYDFEGKVVAEKDASGISRQDVDTALHSYRGEIEQIPPMYSALKHKGKRLYELARQGIEVERPPRQLTVHSLDLVDFDATAGQAVLDMQVSKGFYVRSLAHDMGQDLGVGAHLIALRRTQVGQFTDDDATSLPQIVEAFVENWWPMVTHPLDTALMHYNALVVGAEEEDALRKGQQISMAPSSDDDIAKESATIRHEQSGDNSEKKRKVRRPASRIARRSRSDPAGPCLRTGGRVHRPGSMGCDHRSMAAHTDFSDDKQ